MEKITLPDGWHEVSVGMFQELSQLDKHEGVHKVIELVSILSDRDPEEIKGMHPNDFEKVLAHIQWTGEAISNDYKTNIKIDEVDYYLVKLKSLSVGEWVDLDSWADKSVENMHKIFALLYRPEGEVYDVKKMNERSELFLDKLMISDVHGTLVFFLIIGDQYLKLIRDYTKESLTES